MTPTDFEQIYHRCGKHSEAISALREDIRELARMAEKARDTIDIAAASIREDTRTESRAVWAQFGEQTDKIAQVETEVASLRGRFDMFSSIAMKRGLAAGSVGGVIASILITICLALIKYFFR